MALRGMPEVLFSSFACFSFLTARERRGSWEASWRLWARPGGSSCGKERSGGRRRRSWGGWVMETGAGGVVVCMCVCVKRGLHWKPENPSNYECYPLPGLAVKGAGITIGVLRKGAGEVGALSMRTGSIGLGCTCTNVWSQMFTEASQLMDRVLRQWGIIWNWSIHQLLYLFSILANFCCCKSAL